MVISDQNSFIPIPPFEFYSFVKEKADKFCNYQFKDPWEDPRYAIENVRAALFDFFANEHKVQFLGQLVNYTIDSYTNHEKICQHPQECVAKRGAQEVLYYLYGQLKDVGINVDFNSFTMEEIVENNLILSNIQSDLEQILVNDPRVVGNLEIIKAIESLRADIKSMGDIYSLGKKKWYQTLTGIVAEYSVNKSLDFVIASLLPHFSQIYYTIKIFIAGLIK